MGLLSHNMFKKILLVYVFFMFCILMLLFNDLVELQSTTTSTYEGISTNILFPVYLFSSTSRQVQTVTKVSGEIFIKANFDAPKIQEGEVTILIKTMDKPKCLKNLVSSISSMNPSIKILVADDGRTSSEEAVAALQNVHLFRMPYDSGVAAGRNLLISQAATPYVLVMDDEVTWDPKILTHFMHVMQLHPHLDLVAAQVSYGSKHFSGLMQTVNETLFLIKGDRGILEGTSLPILTSKIENSEPNFSEMGPPCVLVDFVPNFFLARTDSLLKIQWENSLKAGEQEEFFLRFNTGNFRAAYCTSLYVENQQEKCNDMEDAEAVRTRRQDQRTRIRAFTKKGLYMHNVSRLAYCLGEGFASLLWKDISNPFETSEPCQEVPLPETCPLGRVGAKCEKCSPGFTGPQCDQCLPDHFGLQCVPCQCMHGVCVVYGDGADHVVTCVCDAGWFGAMCDTQLQLGENLIMDPTFASLRGGEKPARSLWHKYKDGCARLADDGVWLMNDGNQKCGARYSLALNQDEPLAIVVSTEGRSVGVGPLADPSHYCVYVDIEFNDGSSMDGQLIAFPAGTHSLQYKELIVTVTKPVQLVTVYIVLHTAGNAFFTNLSVRQQIKPA